MNLIFFGSFQHYSAMILQSLITDHRFMITGVVTTPPALVGRKQILTKTPVHLLAEQHHIPVFTPSSLKLEPSELFESPDSPESPVLPSSPDLLLTAGYGKILPQSWLDYPKLGSLNLHFSLLPKYRGANPAEWAIMCGETQTGITLIKMNQKLDGGDILAQAEIPIDPTDTRETLYHNLYTLGAEKLPYWLQQVAANSIFSTQGSEGSRVLQNAIAKPVIQPEESTTPYAALLKRQDGFVPWSTIQKLLRRQSLQLTDFPSLHLQTALKFSLGTNHQSPTTFFTSLPRALAGYPSLWTIVPTSKGDKRLKILSFHQSLGTRDQALNIVQLEGQSPAAFNQIKNLIR